MSLTGAMIIAGSHVRGRGGEIRGTAASTGQALEPAFGGALREDVDAACHAAAAAFDAYRETDLETRAAFLEDIAANLLSSPEELIARCVLESGLPLSRITGELQRTVNQLRLFAEVVRDGRFLGARIDPAQPHRAPAPRVDLRLRNIPLGPVAVFGASNFPLAFSVAGGDTASALAAGCPVVAKAHNAHPGTSELAGRAIAAAVARAGLPTGVFSLLYDVDTVIGQALVAHPAIQAVGFTGSRAGGLALTRLAQARDEPIPVYAEMSSINPVVILPAAVEARGPAIATALVSAVTLGAGQFCTNPGVVLLVDGPATDKFLEAAAAALAVAPAATMLTPRIREIYRDGVASLGARADVRIVGEGRGGGAFEGSAALFTTTSAAFQREPGLRAEIFGAASLVVRCPDVASLKETLSRLDGQLTAAVHADPADHAAAQDLLRILERKVGRIVWNGFGTGVEVGHAMVHGGPYPATSDSRFTSVGSLAITRFLRPVSYQDVPDDLLPPVLRSANPMGASRLYDGFAERAE